jgi:hypothetical protein
VRLTREELDALIAAAAQMPAHDAKADRALGTLLRYLEAAADRFEEPDDSGAEATETSS